MTDNHDWDAKARELFVLLRQCPFGECHPEVLDALIRFGRNAYEAGRREGLEALVGSLMQMQSDHEEVRVFARNLADHADALIEAQKEGK